MTCLTQEILELEMQLKCIREDIIRDWKDETCLKDIMKTIQSTKKKLVDTFGQSLHRLGDFKPKESTVETVVKKFPASMKILNEENQLSIQACIWHISNHALKYIPLLAKEGMKHNVGGEESRGGLLTTDPSWDGGVSWNTLQLALGMSGDADTATKDFDKGIVRVLETLKKEKVLKKEDVSELNLIWYSARKNCQLRFKYILQLDPGAIKGYTYGGKSFMHWLIDHGDLNRLKALLKVTYEMYPEQAGYLFQKDTDGQQAAVERAIRKYGEKETMTTINAIISPTQQFPILHHALIESPKLDTLFTAWFPWASNLRDHNNRTLIQAILAAGGKSVKENPLAFAFMRDDQVCEKDPITTLYPFAAVASGTNGDLEKTFYLLRRQPGVLDRSQRK
ncbi:hypothetical protein CTEN210_02938 [Chaetoceros tenuissimus]|uniref:Uncharacterized protein n=1 Tax=Chaetoceros tenuissimus TaxID=426638 RepID=A0AAD3CIV8_9STRA|nr:hypothetical protein CTEN210_02938 [Chaetoceros tenuissimus]